MTRVMVIAPASSAYALVPPTIPGLFSQHCATCHEAGGDSRAPTRASLEARTPEAIFDALTTGAMVAQGQALSDAEKRGIAEYLAGRRATTS